MNDNQNNQWFQDIVNRGLETFSNYWEYPRIAERWAKKGSIGGGDYYVKERVGNLQKAQAFDPTGLTTFGLLRAYLLDHLDSTHYSALDLMKNWAKYKPQFDNLNAMRLELERPDSLELWSGFENQVEQMGAHYSVEDAPALSKVVRDPLVLPFLNYSASDALERKLKAFQFLQGAGSPDPLKVHQKIYEFWNINALIQAAANQVFDGVALCLVRDPVHEFASFFCIAVKSGETLTVLTDREKGAHPRYNEMSRRPDRDLDHRWDENYFPYHLLDVAQSEDGKRLYMKARKQLVPKNSVMIPVADIGAQSPYEIAWLGILLDKIAKKYAGANAFQLPALSYTGEMIRNASVLVGEHSTLIVQGKYQPLELPVLTKDDIHGDKLGENFEKISYSHNRHVFDRFAAQVPDSALNVVGDAEVKQLREANPELNKEKFDHWGKSTGQEIEIRSFSPLDFGTRDELEKDRVWTARFNQISVIKDLAKKEFDATRDAVVEWFTERVKANQKNLLAYVAAMECVVAVETWSSDYIARMKEEKRLIREGAKKSVWGYTHPFPHIDRTATDVRDILTIEINDKGRGLFDSGWNIERRGGFLFHTSRHDRESFYRCFDTGAKATIGAQFDPEQAAHLALLAGCEIEDLPEQIRHWNKLEPYVGNSILDRIDPEDWFLKDYFRDRLDFNVAFAMSKSFFNDLRRQYGFPRVDWNGRKQADE